MDFGTGGKSQDPNRRIDPGYAPNVPPPPQRQGSTVWRGAKLAFGGCIVLPVLLVVGLVSCVAVLGGNNEPEPEPQDRPAVAIGEPVIAGDAVWTVTGARKATTLTAEFAEPAQGDFVIVNFDFTNNGEEPTTVDSSSLAVVDSEGRKNDADSDKFEYITAEKNLFLENVNPGVTTRGQAIFTVAPDASGFKLEAGDTVVFSDENGYVNLGF